MIRFLLGTDHPRVQDVEAFPNCKGSDRKLRLFACACYHRVRHLLPHPLARAAVGVAERVADGLASPDALGRAGARVREVLDGMEETWRASRESQRTALRPTHEALALALQVTRRLAPKAAWYACSNAYLAVDAIANPGGVPGEPPFGRSQREEERAQAGLLRCLFGN